MLVLPNMKDSAWENPHCFTNSFVDTDPTALNSAIGASQELLDKHLRNSQDPCTPRSKSELQQCLDTIDLDSPLGDPSAAFSELSDIWLNDAVWYHHPRYISHLNCPITATAVGADLLACSVNTAVESWDQAASAALIEGRLIEFFAGKLGWPAPHSEQSAAPTRGVFTSGGTQSNLQALFIAREKALRHPALAELPHHERLAQLRIYTSENAHYSVHRAACLLGLTPESIVTIASTDDGTLKPASLSTQLDEGRAAGHIPMAVVATAGSTDRGAIDPLADIAALTQAAGTHLHVDAAYGGILLLSPQQSHRLAGIDRADSVTIDFHKTFFQPVACSAVITRNASDAALVSWHADYLNPEGAVHHNLADFSLQTTRRFDALKLWTTLRTYGAEALGRAFDQCCDLAQKAAGLINDHADFELLTTPQLSTVLFVPADDADASLITAVRDVLMARGQALIAVTTADNRPCWKFTILDPRLSTDDLASTLQLIAESAHSITQARTPSATDLACARV